MGKIIDTLRAAEAEGRTVVSLEFFPAKTESGVTNLLARIETMVLGLRPAFVTLTWRSAFKDEELWLSIGSRIQREFQVDVLLHLTCHLPVTDLKRILRRARESGIRNILALRGDPPLGIEDRWKPVPGGLSHAAELVALIRAEHGDWFSIAVAAYPEVHLESWNHPSLPPSEQAQATDLAHLRAKVDAGADFAITQFFLEPQSFAAFTKRAAAAGLKQLPILPGYMPVHTFESYSKFTKWSRTQVPADVRRDLDAIRDDDAAVKLYGVEVGVRSLRHVLAQPQHTGGPRALHFYTMNLSFSVQRILEGLALLPPRGAHRPMPWGASSRQLQGEVRPIFWSNRQAAYLARTAQADFDSFPNGRWSLAANASFGELSDYYLAARRPKPDRRAAWGTPRDFEDVKRVFVGYLDGAVPQLPWCDAPAAPETTTIYSQLRWLNSAGFLTVNSQPRVNGLRSDDRVFGWGGPGGYVFQKSYIEFFCTPELFVALLEALPRYPTLTYHAMDASGSREYLNVPPTRANAVTWGVWPGKEILQPTVVDPQAFRVWRSEAFELWSSQWASVYDSESDPADAQARAVIEECRRSLWLVNIVQNDYVSPSADIFDVFRDVVRSGMGKEELRVRVCELEAENSSLAGRLAALRETHAATEGELARALERLRREEASSAALRLQVRQMEAKGVVAQSRPLHAPLPAARAPALPAVVPNAVTAAAAGAAPVPAHAAAAAASR